MAFVPTLSTGSEVLLFALHAAESPDELEHARAGFHALRGKPQRFALAVNKNWRITFGWDEDAAIAVDLEDYH